MKAFTNYWKRVLNYGSSQKGVVLVVVTLALILLTAIITSAHFTIVSQTTSSSSYRLSTQAFYVAEAGAQRAIDWFSHSYTSANLGTVNATTYPPTISVSGSSVPVTFNNITGVIGTYPDSTLRSSFQNYLGSNTSMSGTANNFQIVAGTGGSNAVIGQYIVTATLLSTKQIKVFPGIPKTAEKWRVDSIGRVLNGSVELARADNSAIIETLVTPAVNNAVCVKDSFDFNGQVPVDSYDSSIGMYGPGNEDGVANIGSFATPAGPFTISGPSPSFSGSISIPATRTERPSICPKGGGGCMNNTCDVPDTPAFVDTVSYPPNNATSSGISDGYSSPSFYKAVSCPTGCLTTNDCAPTGVINTTNGGGNPYGPIIQQILGQGGTGSKVGLPSGFTGGDACMWVDTLGFSGGGTKSITIDNLTNRPSGNQGALNIFVSSLSNKNNQTIKIISNKDNPVNIYVRDSVDFEGDVNMNTGSGVTGATHATQNNQGLKIFGKSKNPSTSLPTTGPSILLKSQISGIVYAPRSDMTINGNAGIFGAVITQVFRKNGNPDGVHYDVQLSKDFVNIFNFVPANQIRRIR